MNYKENFENLSWNDQSVAKPIYNFSYSVMKSIGSIIGFIYKTNKSLEEIRKNIGIICNLIPKQCSTDSKVCL